MESNITFISNFEMYGKEESGKKPNTLRDGKYYEKAKTRTHVRIRKGYTKEFFRRKITDVTLWGGKTLISWNPMDGKEQLLLEKLSDLEHQQWMLWSETLWRSDFHNIKRDLDEAMDVNSALRRIKDRKDRWQKNWRPYNELPEDVKEHDRVWARKVLEVIL